MLLYGLLKMVMLRLKEAAVHRTWVKDKQVKIINWLMRVTACQVLMKRPLKPTVHCALQLLRTQMTLLLLETLTKEAEFLQDRTPMAMLLVPMDRILLLRRLPVCLEIQIQE